MSAKRMALNLTKTTMVLCIAVYVSGCSMLTERVSTSTPSSESPLPEFILGEWLSIEAKSTDLSVYNIQYKIVFETKEQVKLIVIYPDGNTEGYTFGYKFVGQDTIYVDNIRTTGGETWRLEKSNNKLIITRNLDSVSIRIVLERIK